MRKVFDRLWFAEKQNMLLEIANTSIGRRILCINGNKSSVGKKEIVGILPNAIYWKGEGENQYIGEFRTHDKFAKRIFYAFKPFWYLLHFWDTLFANNFRPAWNLGFDTTGDLFPVAGANSPCDGSVGRESVNETFSSIRIGAGTTAVVTDAGANTPALIASTTSNQFANLRRLIFNYDTSSIGASNVISAATLSLDSGGKGTGLGTPDYHITGATPAATNTLATTDYAQVQFTSFASIANASLNTAGVYNDFTLNASGLANISKTGVSSFAGILSWDQSGTFGGTWASSANAYFNTTLADTAGTADDPKLVVTYSVPTGAKGMPFMIY